MDITTYIRILKQAKICDAYNEKVAHAGSKKALMDVALDINGMKWLCESIAKGHFNVDEICHDFEPFLNAKYTREADGYSSAMYCKNDDDIYIHTTAALIIGCNGNIHVTRPCELHIVKSRANIIDNGLAKVYNYGV